MFVLGAVVLCVTGGEALYADLGHFGRVPIALAWYAVVFPALLLSYFGQGAYLLRSGAEGVASPFFGLLPAWGVLPMVGIATLATIVASQAVISGSFSLTAQAIQLGYLPRMQIVHTSSRQEGQIYIPAVNWFLMLACIALVLEFRAVVGTRGRVRNRGDRHDGGHHRAVRAGGAAALRLAGGARARRGLPDRRPRVPRAPTCRRSRTAARSRC